MNKKDRIEAVYKKAHRMRNIKFPSINHEFTKMDMMVLGEVMHYKEHTGDDINVTDLSKKTCYPLQSLSRTIKNLEQKGYVERKTSKENRRKTVVLMTEEGQIKMKKHKDKMDEFFDNVFSHFTNDELDSFIKFEDKFFEVIKLEGEKMLQEPEKED